MARKYERKVDNSRRRKYSEQQVRSVLESIQKKKCSFKEAAHQYEVPKTTLQRILKQESKSLVTFLDFQNWVVRRQWAQQKNVSLLGFSKYVLSGVFPCRAWRFVFLREATWTVFWRKYRSFRRIVQVTIGAVLFWWDILICRQGFPKISSIVALWYRPK
jgi:hypothetical protein